MGRGKRNQPNHSMLRSGKPPLRTRLFDPRYRKTRKLLENVFDSPPTDQRLKNEGEADEQAYQVFQTILKTGSKDDKTVLANFIWESGAAPEAISLEHLAAAIQAEEKIQLSLRVYSQDEVQDLTRRRLERVKAQRGVDLSPAFLEQQYDEVAKRATLL